MSIVLRDYQESCVNDVRQKLRTSKNVLLQAPTGAGKTAMAAYMLGNVEKKGKIGFFICHRKELVDQTAKTLDKVGIKYGYIASGYPQNFYQQIQICSVDTLKNRLGKTPNPDFCIWDEAHHLRAAGWVRVHEYFSDAFHVGLSATPQRLDGKGLNDRFDDIALGPPVKWLIDNNFLAKYKLFSVPGVDMSAVHTRMGDFVTAEAEQAMDRPSITGNIVAHWIKHAAGKKTIGFAASIAHSQHCCESFNNAGIKAIHLDGSTPKAERRAVLQAFARGEYDIVFNVALFAEGFDIAANSGLEVTVGCVIDAAPTQALGNWLQRCGRALRKQDGHAVILDHAGNFKRHGLPCEDRKWNLEGREKPKKGASDSDEAVTVKQCPECFCCHIPDNSCPECGFIYPVKERKIEEVEGDLAEIDIDAFKREQRMSQGRANDVESLVALGHSEGRAKHILEARIVKSGLQNQLFNLSQGAKMAGIDIDFTHSDIRKMKPKMLKTKIEQLTQELDGGITRK